MSVGDSDKQRADETFELYKRRGSLVGARHRLGRSVGRIQDRCQVAGQVSAPQRESAYLDHGECRKPPEGLRAARFEAPRDDLCYEWRRSPKPCQKDRPGSVDNWGKTG